MKLDVDAFISICFLNEIFSVLLLEVISFEEFFLCGDDECFKMEEFFNKGWGKVGFGALRHIMVNLSVLEKCLCSQKLK